MLVLGMIALGLGTLAAMLAFRQILRHGVAMVETFLLAIGVAIAVYLFYTMIRPERF